MAKRIRQAQRNVARELFHISSRLNHYAQSLVISDVPGWTVEGMTELEHDLLSAINFVHQAKAETVAGPRIRKGQAL